MNDNLIELMSAIERYIKGGRMSFQLLLKDNADQLEERELCVEFDDKGEPRLYIKNNQNEIVPIRSKAEDLIEEFLIKFIEVSKTKKYNYTPSLWFKLINDTGGFNQSNINEFYNYIKTNLNSLNPYIQYVRTNPNGEEKGLVPFVTTDAVYFDLGKIIDGKGITNTTTTITEIFRFVTDFKNSLDNILNSINGTLGGLINDLKHDFDELQSQYGNQNTLINNIMSKIDQIYNKFNSINSNIEKSYVRKDLQMGGGSYRFLDITNNANSGINIVGFIEGKPSSPIIVYLENSSGSKVVVELGQNGYITNVSGITDEYTVRVLYNGGGQLLFNVTSILNGWRLSVAGGITARILSRGGNVTLRDSGSGDSNVNNVPRWGSSGVWSFNKNNTLITKGINMGGYILDIV